MKMDHGTVMTVFVVIAAIALATQAAVLVAFYLLAQRINQELSRTSGDIRRQVDLATGQILEIIESAREPIRIVTANIAEVSRIIRERTGQLDEALDDLTEKSRQQAARVDQLITDLIAKVEETA
ncbi:MAG TPA: hypothetical protein VKV79_06425, partial [Terriglobia bacterium]|nr:hypothetical protein [Terriglobia bacterium]